MFCVKKKPTGILRRLSGFDAMSNVLGLLGLQSRVVCRTEFGGPWIMPVSSGELAHFHIVERGVARFQLDEAHSPLLLSAGDLLLVTRRQAYSLRNPLPHPDPYTFQMPQADPGGRCQFLRVGGRAPSTSFVCGAFIFSHANHPLLTMLPRFMYLRSGKHGHEILTRSIVKSLIAEVTNMQAGSETVISRLMDLFFIHTLRTWLSQQPQGSAWLKAVNDQRIGPTLARIHGQPERIWTVQRLASDVGLSRSRFSVLFSELVGESPQNYVTRMRLQRAGRLLQQQANSLTDVALATGYESDASFSKAFRRQYGKTPGQYRRDSIV
jgi:AraC-like DNA-binding protein